MQTNFSLAQLADPDIAEANQILRTCVHCGFCTATCPTYVLLGDELDSPRGRIYMIKDMLEQDKPAPPRVVKHLDRCLTCLSCMTTCPSGVHYMHLVDHARRHVAETFTRPLPERLLRGLLAVVLVRPWLFRLSLLGAWLSMPFKRLLPGRLKALVDSAPSQVPAPSHVDQPQVFAAAGPRRARVAILSGCAQQVLATSINEATVRLLTRNGVDVVVAKGAGCCGALTHHMGQEAAALASAKANIAAWHREVDGEGLDAVVITASGCGTTVKDYGFMLRQDPEWADKAARISGMTRDITEFLSELGPAGGDSAVQQAPGALTIAYQSACSMQHGQKITQLPKQLLSAAGYTVKEVPEGHLCCGSAGTYSILQPELAGRLRERKLGNIESLRPDVIASGNIGCMAHIGGATEIPIVHTVELLDWASGGPKPAALEQTGR